ncbi:hypothetical protein SPRG_21708 [Saprolegnia parasitica CBS 223.65]|uniref:Disintegrin domain-containing protein n=1 Tax=Saprolegnia parasitica (strain CBS 223.65) TaxID=695850 RepID=A0A067BUT6_SAPPC|nr:hypothetical protein SPRG_21708 [Saprolegnia parasitica CBS 223.65]KDO18382.1 hypothetical protein SPRG_21708 [Saprolegnia parasitica CBS 223.65]|eukprot:XP_012210912.1 hypothetical protein SPRG_21708 [Saprolegnia parasitica CBS 223.65]
MGKSTGGPCDAPDYCDGRGRCVDKYESNRHICRRAVDVCDEAETCTGVSGDCPSNSLHARESSAPRLANRRAARATTLTVATATASALTTLKARNISAAGKSTFATSPSIARVNVASVPTTSSRPLARSARRLASRVAASATASMSVTGTEAASKPSSAATLSAAKRVIFATCPSIAQATTANAPRQVCIPNDRVHADRRVVRPRVRRRRLLRRQRQVRRHHCEGHVVPRRRGPLRHEPLCNGVQASCPHNNEDANYGDGYASAFAYKARQCSAKAAHKLVSVYDAPGAKRRCSWLLSPWWVPSRLSLPSPCPRRMGRRSSRWKMATCR